MGHLRWGSQAHLMGGARKQLLYLYTIVSPSRAQGLFSSVVASVNLVV